MACFDHPWARQLLRRASELQPVASLPPSGRLSLEACSQSAQPEGTCDLGAYAQDRTALASSRPHRASLPGPTPVPSDLRQEPSAVTPRAGICAGGAGTTGVPTANECGLPRDQARRRRVYAEQAASAAIKQVNANRALIGSATRRVTARAASVPSAPARPSAPIPSPARAARCPANGTAWARRRSVGCRPGRPRRSRPLPPARIRPA
jgi:hypothetical protein